MRRCALALFGLTLLAGCGSTSASSPAPRGAASRGARLFVTDRCVTCHIVNGVGGNRGPELTKDPVASDYHLLSQRLAQPPTPMAFVKRLHLTPQQIADLSAFANSTLKPKR